MKFAVHLMLICFSFACKVPLDHDRISNRTKFIHDYTQKITVVDTITIVKPYVYSYHFKDLKIYYEIVKDKRFARLKHGLDTIGKETIAPYMFQTYYFAKTFNYILKKKIGCNLAELSTQELKLAYNDLYNTEMSLHKQELKELHISDKLFEIVKNFKGRYSLFVETIIYSNAKIYIPFLIDDSAIPEYSECQKIYLVDKVSRKIIYYDNVIVSLSSGTPDTWNYPNLEILLKGLGKYFK